MGRGAEERRNPGENGKSTVVDSTRMASDCFNTYDSVLHFL